MSKSSTRTQRSSGSAQRAWHDAVSSALRWTRVTLIALGMVLMSPGAAGFVRVYAQSDPAATDAGRIDALFRSYEAVLDSVDPTTVDVEELAFEFAFESPESIAEWVQEHIAYHPYRGLLRGPQGTLLASAGNGLDQAALLAKLLNDAGYEARIARAELPEDRTTDVWNLASNPPPRDDVQLPESTVVGENALLSESQFDEGRARVEAAIAEYEETFARERDALSSLLAADPSWTGAGGSVAEHLVETTYSWVEVRLSAEEAWTAFHPVFATVPSWLDVLEPDVTYSGSIPSDVQHRLRFQVVIEQRLGGELAEKAVTGAWERPVANLLGQSFTFATLPDTLSDPAREAGDMDAAFTEAVFLYPMFNDALAPGAQLFDLSGNTAPPEAASSPAAGIFQAVGNAFGGAAGALGGDDEPVAMTAQWMEFTLIEPGGAETVYRRAIFDRIGASNRAAGRSDLLDSVTEDDVVDALQASHSFMVDPGAYPARFVQRSSAERMVQLEPYFRSLFAAGPDADVEGIAPPPELIATMRSLEHLRLFLTFDARIAPPDVVTYRPQPSLSLISKRWDGSREISDVVQNSRVSLERGEDGAVRLLPAHAQAQGVWETVTEGVVLTEGGERFSVPEYMRLAREQGVPFEIIDAAAEIDVLDVPDESRAAMRTDLERGFLVVSPRGVPEGMTHAAWWRVDPTTGTTLGRGWDGRGLEFTTYITLSGIAISVVFGIAGYASCRAGGGSGSCCLEEGVGMFAVGFALGVAAGWVAGALGLSGLAAANLGMGVGAGFDVASTLAGLMGFLPTGCTSSDRHDRGPERLTLAEGIEAPTCDTAPMLRAYFLRALGASGA